MTYIQDYMDKAIELAENSVYTGCGGPFGAVVVKDSCGEGYGHNKVIKHHDPTAHAEIIAIRNACSRLQTHDLTGCDLYASSEPCPMCLGAVYWSNIHTVYYVNGREVADRHDFRDDFIYAEMAMHPWLRMVPLIKKRAMNALRPFTMWHEKQDAQLY